MRGVPDDGGARVAQVAEVGAEGVQVGLERGGQQLAARVAEEEAQRRGDEKGEEDGLDVAVIGVVVVCVVGGGAAVRLLF